MKQYFIDLADKVLDWAYDNGYVDQLASLATNTAGLRSAILTAASMSAAYGLTKGSWSESSISLGVVVASWALNSFVAYARNKHTKELQAVVGVPTEKQDGFIGKETLQIAKDTAAIQTPVNEKA